MQTSGALPRSAAVTWRAEATISTVIRSALARAGIDAAQATRLCVDQAALALAAISDTPEVQRFAGGSPAQDRGRERGARSRNAADSARVFAGVDGSVEC